jgi:hypothetical protein
VLGRKDIHREGPYLRQYGQCRRRALEANNERGRRQGERSQRSRGATGALFSVRACHDRDAGGEFPHREAKIRTLGVRRHCAHRFSVTAGSSSTCGRVRIIGRWRSCIGLITPAQTNGLSPSRVSQLMKGELPSTTPTKGHPRLQSLAGWASVSLEKRSSLHGDGRSTHGASASFWHLSGAVP